MTDKLTEHDQASPFEAATPYLDTIERRIEEAAERLSYARHMLDAVDEALAIAPGPPDQLRAREDVAGQVARRVDRLRERLARAASGIESPATATLTVRELAEAIGQSEHTTRRLLDAGVIPDARRKTPRPNSPWIIPATAPVTYLASHHGKDSHAASRA